MSQPGTTPEAEGQVSDAVRGNWVDHYAPAWTRPYLRLSRADRPIGTWLLLLPCWWGLLLAMVSDGQASWFDLWIFLGCGIGAFLMRGAGCTWNDITDRKIDGSVARTRSRPIPSGAVSVPQALAWLVVQALIAFFILITFDTAAIILGIVALVQSRKAGAKNGFAVAAIIISSVLMVIGIIIAVVLIAALGPLLAACGELGPGVWELTDGTVITCG